jgi:Flp pilus assembly protein TadG
MTRLRYPGDERGQVTVLVIGLAVVAAAVVGVAVDGTRAFIHRRSLQNAADAAALAGASEIDPASFYEAGGQALELEAARAERAARALLARRAVGATAAIEASPEGVTVALREQVDTTFLALVGIGEIPVAVEATSEPVPRPAG